ncbi:MAG: DUF2190 family protein [Candidatus Accumulibacter sp.]|jgi:hypothetical protein|nr:DUF2190 family protein [Accumulibacter sp.]
MKTQQTILTTSVLAATALTRRRFVGFDGDVCAEGAPALGVVEADTEAGSMAPANVLGVILVEAGAPVAAGGQVQSDAEGRAIPLTTKALEDANEVAFTIPAAAVNGVAWDAATEAGDLIRVLRVG